MDRSMAIHPSLNELTGWAFSMLKPVNFKDEGVTSTTGH
jgi:hypothetical protein